MRLRLSALALVAAVSLVETPARADAHGDAVKLFDEGRRLRDAKDYVKAIETFERSIAIEPSIGAYFNLGTLHEAIGRPRDALVAYRAAKDLAHDRKDAREADAEQAIAKILAGSEHVILDVPADVAKAPGLRVLVDDEPVAPRELGGEVFRRGTSHVVVVGAEGHKDRRITAASREVVTLQLGESLVAPASAAAAKELPPPATEASTGWSSQRWVGVGLVGGGVVAGVVSGVFAARYASERSGIEDRFAACKATGGVCTPDEVPGLPADAERSASKQQTDSTVALVAGGVGLAAIVAGAYFFVTAPASGTARTATMRVLPLAGRRDAGLAVSGSF